MRGTVLKKFLGFMRNLVYRSELNQEQLREHFNQRGTSLARIVANTILTVSSRYHAGGRTGFLRRTWNS